MIKPRHLKNIIKTNEGQRIPFKVGHNLPTDLNAVAGTQLTLSHVFSHVNEYINA